MFILQSVSSGTLDLKCKKNALSTNYKRKLSPNVPILRKMVRASSVELE